MRYARSTPTRLRSETSSATGPRAIFKITRSSSKGPTDGVTPSIGPLQLDLVILRMAIGPVALDVSLLSLVGVLLAYLIARSLF